ncbi:hypothetical protein [Chryseobacterium sp. T20]|uniref:hypothetical protein n=1 Tax=Chryseobacterium sp. T20 TaxID=3395375 RepID=UPI0039BD1C30
MKMINFLIIGENNINLDFLINLIKSNDGWKAVIYNNEDLTRKHLFEYPVDILLLSSDIGPKFENEVKKIIGSLRRRIKVIKYEKGGFFSSENKYICYSLNILVTKIFETKI